MASHLTHRPRVTLTRDHYNNALEDVMRTFPEHAALLHEHRAAIVDSLATGNDHAVLATVVHPTAFAAADVAASADALALAAADVTGCLLQVAIVIADHLSLLLGLLGVVGIDVLAPIKAWIGSLAPSVVNFVRTAAAQLVAAASAMDKAKKAAAIMMAVVAAGGLAAVWQSIKNWSWWQWVKLIVGTGATVVAWFASGGTLLIAKVVGVIVNAVTLALDIATMIKVCGPPSSPGQAPDSTKAAYWATGDLKQGSGFVSMQVADVNGDGRDELVQFWNNRGQMGAIVYSWNGSALSTLWGTSNIGQGAGFVSMQVANLRGDGKKQIVQFWNNRGQMGAIVYGWNGTALTTLWGTSNIGQGSGFVSMQVADVNGDGRDEIVQFWNNRGQMGAIVYGWNGSALTTLWGTSNIGQGSGFVSMQVADVNGDHKKEIIQFWNNRGQMGAIVYAWNGSALTTLWGTSNIGQGAGFVSMQALDLIGDGHEDIVQFWNNRGQMGAIVYHWNGTALTTLWGTPNIGQGSGTLGIQSGRYIGNPAAEGAQRETIVQTWSNSGKMSLIYYGWNGTALETIAGETSDQGSGFVSLVTGKVLGDGCDQVVQFWNNRGQMGAIIYAVDQEGKVPTTPAAAGPVAHL